MVTSFVGALAAALEGAASSTASTVSLDEDGPSIMSLLQLALVRSLSCDGRDTCVGVPTNVRCIISGPLHGL